MSDEAEKDLMETGRGFIVFDGPNCPWCGHDWKYHRNTMGCCVTIPAFDDSDLFEGAARYCYCERTSGPKHDA